MDHLIATVEAVDPVPWLWPILLTLFGVYLVGLGCVAWVDPRRANRFLGAFAQTRFANLVEAIVRALVGLAFVAVSPNWGGVISAIGGMFLIATAAAMLIFPSAHRHLATVSTSTISPFVRWVGLASIMLGSALILALVFAAY